MRQQPFAPDNVDRMFLRVLEETFESEPWRRAAPIAVVNDATGALSSWAIDQGLDIRLIQDSAALASAQADLDYPIATVPSSEALADVATVLYRLARPLEALEEFSWQVARWAAPNVVLLAGQLQRHLNFSMNTVLDTAFDDVSASRGYSKARALRAQTPKPLTGEKPPRMPRKNSVTVAQQKLQLRAYGLTFGAARLDPGTNVLLETLLAERRELFSRDAMVVDLGCGNGTIAATLARATPVAQLIASDDSASAVESTRATLEANHLDQVRVMHQSGLAQLEDHCVDVVVLNPPFHDGTELTSDIAQVLFAEAARTLKPGGMLLTVFNASRGYRDRLRRVVGPTEQLSRNTRFIVTQSQKV